MADNDWRHRARGWSHSDRLAHPDSYAGGTGPGHSRRPGGTHESWPAHIPHWDSPAGRHFPWGNLILDVGLQMPGRGRSVLLWVFSKHLKVAQPFSTALLQHYVEGSGEPYDLNNNGPIPEEWQAWIVRATGAKAGRRHLNPYNAKPFIPDLKNSLGHFDVIVTAKEGSSVRIYQIEKNPYQFGFKPHDAHRTGQHGFELPPMSDTELQHIKALLPTRTYHNPGGFSEGFDIKMVHGKWTVYVPQDVATRAGKPFRVYGRFER